jgi:hypothetical protein
MGGGSVGGGEMKDLFSKCSLRPSYRENLITDEDMQRCSARKTASIREGEECSTKTLV